MLRKEWGDPESSTSPSASQRLLESLFGMLSILAMLAIIVSAAMLIASPAWGHGGGLAADGCHNDRKTGTRHCHRAANNSSQQEVQAQRQQGGPVYYRNCDAARAAGAAPVRRGQPGYARHLDRDNDGVGCEN